MYSSMSLVKNRECEQKLDHLTAFINFNENEHAYFYNASVLNCNNQFSANAIETLNHFRIEDAEAISVKRQKLISLEECLQKGRIILPNIRSSSVSSYSVLSHIDAKGLPIQVYCIASIEPNKANEFISKLSKKYLDKNDYIVLNNNPLVDSANLWRADNLNGQGFRFLGSRIQLISSGIQQLFNYGNPQIQFELEHHLSMGNYLAAAIYASHFEQKVLIGDPIKKAAANSFSKGVLQNYQKLREDGTAGRLFLKVDKEYLVTDGIADFCREHNLAYSLILVR